MDCQLQRGSVDTWYLDEVDPSCPYMKAAGASCTSSGTSPDSMLSMSAGQYRFSSLVLEFGMAVVPLSGFIVLYLGLILEEWPITMEIAAGLVCVVIGLALFKLGLMSGLMPLGESIGQDLPERVPATFVVLISFFLGVLVTYSEPGINSLQLVGELLHRRKAQQVSTEFQAADLLLMKVLNPLRSFHLLTAVACGVGFAAACGLLRLRQQYGIKPFLVCCVVPLLGMTRMCKESVNFAGIVGVSWDCGAITTGPATVPIVIALGIGFAKASQKASGTQKGYISGPNSQLDGFGIVTFASLIPVMTVLLFSMMCSGELEEQAHKQSSDGQLMGQSPGTHANISRHPFLLGEMHRSISAVLPLTLFLLGVQACLAPQRVGRHQMQCILPGILETLFGLFVFNVGLTYGSVPLGEMAGKILPRALMSETIFSRWGIASPGGLVGKLVVMGFGFISGFIATVIDLEPCGLGETVERLSKGRFSKRDLVISVASGVGVGIVLGFAKVFYKLDLMIILGVGYVAALALSFCVDEGLCCVAWDSAGVTTGPVTVPLVLSLGCGICSELSSYDGFGILACASVCPIISVLLAAILRNHSHQSTDYNFCMASASGAELAEVCLRSPTTYAGPSNSDQAAGPP